ncbi:MAG: hypothetical protein AAGC60_23480 [Acidobacteriota bacterium]
MPTGRSEDDPRTTALEGLEPLLALRPELEIVADAVEAFELPPTYRALLAHDQDMTSTLEAHHGEPIDLEPLVWRRDEAVLRREVRLLTRTTRRAVEYGAITIELGGFGDEARQAILEGREPLGSILARCGPQYSSRPHGFFHLRSGHVDEVLDLTRASRLWGRANRLASVDGERTLATVVEVLPPLRAQAAG